jgi:hypothetical protein
MAAVWPSAGGWRNVTAMFPELVAALRHQKIS